MIQLHEYSMVITHPDGRIQPLSLEDLSAHLFDHHEEAQLLEPWLLEKVVETLIRHYKDELGKDQVGFNEFISVARKLLHRFVQEAIQLGQNTRLLDLYELAQHAGTGFELDFYAELRRQMHRHSSPSRLSDEKPEKDPSPIVPNLHLIGLRQCAKFLSGRRRWSKNCSRLRDEIVGFIRAEAERTGVEELRLSVRS